VKSFIGHRPAVYVVFAFALGWLGLMSIKLIGGASDVPRYFTYGEAVRHGQLPYRDFRVEYPPGSLVAFVAPALVASGYRGYRIAFEVLMGLCGLGLLAATGVVLTELRARVVPGLAFVAAATIALGPLTLGHYDHLPALFVSAALAALLGRRPTTSAVLLGLAIATKLYALVIVPVAVTWIWRTSSRQAATRFLGIACATVVVIFLPFVALSPGGIAWSIGDQLNRPLQLESSASAGLLVLHQVAGRPLGIDFSHRSVNLGGSSANAAAVASTLLELATLAVIWIGFGRGSMSHRRVTLAAAASVFAFVALGKVFSPQFLLWLIPLAPLVVGTPAIAAMAGLAASVVLTRAYFPERWRDLILFEPLPVWLLAVRDAIVVALLVALLTILVRRPTTPTATSPTAPATPQAGLR
jgi:hypothetical protein